MRYKHDLIDYIVDLPMTMSIQGILKDYKLIENDMHNNLIDREKLIDLIIDYIEAYDIEIEVSYFFLNCE